MLYYVKNTNGDLFLFAADSLYDLAEQVERVIGISENVSYEKLGDYVYAIKIDMSFYGKDEIIFSEKDSKHFTKDDVQMAQAWHDRCN